VALEAETSWQLVGSVAPTSLTDARLQLHHAVQLVVAAGISYLPARADDSHTNFEWLPRLQSLAGNALSPDGFRLAVRAPTLELLALDEDREVAHFPLSGETNDGALAWMRTLLHERGMDGERLTTQKHYEIPAHAVARGAPYMLERDAHSELARHYHDAWLITSRITDVMARASAPRCWPHHFDLATLISLDAADAETRRTIGVGMSPGDDSYAEPYWYVGPYPRPPADRLPQLHHGRWHTTGWLGAVLTASEVTREMDADRQRQRVERFSNEAVSACTTLLTSQEGAISE
jgi:hypothetical protein